MTAYTGFTVAKYMAVRSLCSEYRREEGCYNDVATFSGVAQHYLFPPVSLAVGAGLTMKMSR
eukprot:619598-Alexandrium_andersonii.AAC.1